MTGADCSGADCSGADCSSVTCPGGDWSSCNCPDGDFPVANCPCADWFGDEWTNVILSGGNCSGRNSSRTSFGCVDSYSFWRS